METDWQALGDINFHKWKVYDMEWDISEEEFETMIYSVANFGGPVAIMPRQALVSTKPKKDAGKICSMNGRILADIPNEACGIVGFGWVEGKELLLVQVYQNGAIHAVTACGEKPLVGFGIKHLKDGNVSSKIFDIFDGKSDDTVMVTKIEDNAIICLLASRKMLIVHTNGTITHLNCGLSISGVSEMSVASIVLLPPTSTQAEKEPNDASAFPSVLVSLRNAEILEITKNEVLPKHAGTTVGIHEAVVKMAITPHGRFIACFQENGILVIMNRACDKVVLEFDTKSRVEPLQLCWCGEDSIVMQWRQIGLLMIGPYGDWVKYTYEDPVIIVQEVDSLRVITPSEVDILQRVDSSTEAVFRIGSFAPAALLHDAVEAVADSDPQADENIRSLKDEGTLRESILDCIHAAALSFDVSQQRSLLRAASAGKVFCDDDGDRRECAAAFLQTCSAVRTLNVLRHPSVSWPLTVRQLERLTPKRLVYRLSSQRMHFLALKLCAYLRLPLGLKQHVLMHWASCKVQSFSASPKEHQENITRTDGADADAEKTLFETIQTRLSPVRGIRYELLCRLARTAGNTKLASLMAHAEPVSLKRVIRLLVLAEHLNSLAYAVHSHDASLILFVILCVWPGIDRRWTKTVMDVSSLSRGEKEARVEEFNQFFSVVSKFPVARDALIEYCLATKNYHVLRSFYEYLRKPSGVARVLIAQSYTSDTMDKRISKLSAAANMYGREVDTTYYATLTAEQMKLLNIQRELEVTTGRKCFVDNSLADTIFNCMILDLDKKAQQLRDEFKASDTLFYHLRVKALAQLGDWLKLRQLASERRMPLSFLAFAQACVEAQNMDEARYYALLVKDDEDRLEAFIKTKSWDSAIGLAVQLKDLTTLQLVHNTCEDADLQLSIMEHVHRISSDHS